MKKQIAVDAMGGDFGPPVVVPAALQALARHPELELTLVGDEHVLQATLRQHHADVGERLQIRHASQRVEMDEPPSQALRTKKDSSMRVAIDMVKDGAVQACVSAGNTGALMATARFVLKMLPGRRRPPGDLRRHAGRHPPHPRTRSRRERRFILAGAFRVRGDGLGADQRR